MGWAAGKLLEKGGAALTEPPTRRSLLAGLWAIKRDNLGGLVAPLTFEENHPPAPFVCWFEITIRGGAWQSPDSFRPHCR